MDHARTTIRNTLATLLTGLPTSDARVFKSRALIYQDHELPALSIVTNDEEIEYVDIHGRILERAMTVLITAKAKVTDDLDEVLDTMMAEVEAKIANDLVTTTLAAFCKSIELRGLTININEDGEMPIGEAAMRFNLIYYTNASAPGVSI